MRFCISKEFDFKKYEYAKTIEGAEMAKPAKPPIGYYGAKQRIASQIVKMLPPHNAWVEGFCGSAAITLSRPPAPIEIINDIDNQIVNMFNQLGTGI